MVSRGRRVSGDHVFRQLNRLTVGGSRCHYVDVVPSLAYRWRQPITNAEPVDVAEIDVALEASRVLSLA
jgi:hypothetical protein